MPSKTTKANISGALGASSELVPTWRKADGWRVIARPVAFYAGETSADAAAFAEIIRASFETRHDAELASRAEPCAPVAPCGGTSKVWLNPDHSTVHTAGCWMLQGAPYGPPFAPTVDVSAYRAEPVRKARAPRKVAEPVYPVCESCNDRTAVRGAFCEPCADAEPVIEPNASAEPIVARCGRSDEHGYHRIDGRRSYWCVGNQNVIVGQVAEPEPEPTAEPAPEPAPMAPMAEPEPTAEPAPVLVALQPAQRPTCERCGQVFRMHGTGAEWHRVNRPDCAAGRLSVVA